MPVMPISPRIGQERKKRTQMTLEEMMRQEAARRSMLSRFARSGARRGAPRSMNPIRGGGGIRAFSGGFPTRPIGSAPGLQNRGPGANPHARVPWDDLPGGGPGMPTPPRVGPPAPLPTDRLQSTLPDSLFGEQTAQPLPTELLGQQSAQLNPAVYEQFLGQTSPSSPLISGNLIPLGGGRWLDLSTGVVRGAGGGGFRAQ